VESILEKLAAGEAVEQILESHPYLTRESIQAALAKNQLDKIHSLCDHLLRL
jgi:uncharacterized protein (DUF433 family)